MWGFVLFIAAVIVWPTSAQGEQVYLATVDNWAFFKIRSTGQMNGDTVRATCEAAGMRMPCRTAGLGSCKQIPCRCTALWEKNCITYDPPGYSCNTLDILANELCVDADAWFCEPLDDTFVYSSSNMFGSDSAAGIDFETHTQSLQGNRYYDKYALCAEKSQCASSPCARGSCTDGVGGYTCSCEYGWTGRNCSQAIGDCAPGPCQNGGSCYDRDEDSNNKYTCRCPTGFRGDHCELDIDWCIGVECQNGFVCKDKTFSYECVEPDPIIRKSKANSATCLCGMYCIPVYVMLLCIIFFIAIVHA